MVEWCMNYPWLTVLIVVFGLIVADDLLCNLCNLIENIIFIVRGKGEIIQNGESAEPTEKDEPGKGDQELLP